MIKWIIERLFREDEKEIAWKKYCVEQDLILVAEEKEHSIHRYKEYLAATKRGFDGGSPWFSFVYPNYPKLRKWEQEQNEPRA